MEFNNVKVVKKSTVYFDGKVTSRTIYSENGERKCQVNINLTQVWKN